MDQQQSVFLKASGALLDREAQSLDRAGDIVGQQRQFKPSGVDCEVLAGHVSSAQGVFDLVMHMLNGAGFLPAPIQQPVPSPTQVGDHGVMMAVTAVAKEDSLRFEQAQSHIDRKSTRLNSSHLVISYAV